jgi:hypothetical protein
MAVFIASVVAIKQDTEELVFDLQVIPSDTMENATRLALLKGKKRLPPESGYINHGVILGEVPREELEVLLNKARTKADIPILN